MASYMLEDQTLWSLIMSGGFTMIPLLVCSLIMWGVIFERLWSYRRLGNALRVFHLESIHFLLRNQFEGLRELCQNNRDLPTASLMGVALDRIQSSDIRLKSGWLQAVERKRMLLNLELRRNLWILGTIASVSPFIGLFGTVVGILRSFQEMAKTGSGGFAVVASGISESLIATASGICVAVIAVMAFNAFQMKCGSLVLTIRIQMEEWAEILTKFLEALDLEKTLKQVSEKKVEV